MEVIDRVHETMLTRWSAEGRTTSEMEPLWNEYIATYLLPRLHGYELLMAPHAIAYLKVGIKLLETGYRFSSEERARIYLTNALEPEHDFTDRLALAVPALAHEAEAVNEIKRSQRFTVVIGNPPYAATSSNPGRTDNGEMTYAELLIQRCFSVRGKPLGERNPRWLQDDYVKFIGLAQQLVETTRTGIVGLVTNNGYLENPTFRGLRTELLQSFSRISILDLHGNLRNVRLGRRLTWHSIGAPRHRHGAF